MCCRAAGGPKRRLWRKIHIHCPGRRLRSNLPKGGVDEQTLEIRAIEITGSNTGDAPMLPELLSQIPADAEIGPAAGDGACDTCKCHDAIADRGAHAVIPPRRNANQAETLALNVQ